MKVLTTAGLTKLIQLIKSSFIKTTDTVTTNTITLADVATSGDYDDLINQPTIGNGTITFTQGGVTKGTITTNQTGNSTIALDAGGGTATDVQINGISITSNNVADIITEGVYNATTNKIATIADIPSIPTVDQTYDGTSANAQSGVAIEGELTTSYQSKLVSGTNIKTINNTSLLGSGNITVDSLPSQTGQSGKFLTTNGSVASWSDTTKVTFRDWSVT